MRILSIIFLFIVGYISVEARASDGYWETRLKKESGLNFVEYSISIIDPDEIKAMCFKVDGKFLINEERHDCQYDMGLRIKLQ